MKMGVRAVSLQQKGRIHMLVWGGVWALTRIRKWLYTDATVYLERKRAIFDGIPPQRGTSRFVGVYWSACRSKWIARVYEDGKTRHIGCYDDEELAARAYDAEVWRIYGGSANLNFPGIALSPTGAATAEQ